ncbi:hypothetical protein ACOMHN_015551 [Nucella lapillus]
MDWSHTPRRTTNASHPHCSSNSSSSSSNRQSTDHRQTVGGKVDGKKSIRFLPSPLSPNTVDAHLSFILFDT